MLLYRTLVIAVSDGISGLSPEFSHLTYETAYELFTPNESGQRAPYVLPRLLARSWPELLL